MVWLNSLNGLIYKRLNNFETVNSLFICSELTIFNKKWVCFNVYRPPSQENLKLFFDELSSWLSKASETYNKPNCFQHMYVTETGFSDFHKTTGTFFKAKITRLKPRNIYYRNYKNFDKSSFLLDLKSTNLDSPSIDPDENYIFLTNQFLKVVNQHAPLKVKILRGNHALFVDKQPRKEICKRRKLRNKYCTNPSK